MHRQFEENPCTIFLAFRALVSTPTVGLLAILSLALGIGANAALFSLVNSLVLRSLPVEQPQRLALVSGGIPTFPFVPLLPGSAFLSGHHSVDSILGCGAASGIGVVSLFHSSLPFKSRRPAEHEREPSERIRRETQEAIALGTHAPELLVARNRPDRDTWRRQNESFSEPHVHLHGLCVWSDVEERLPVRSPDWGGAACRGDAHRPARTRQGTHIDFWSAGLVRDVHDVLPVRRDAQKRDLSRRR